MKRALLGLVVALALGAGAIAGAGGTQLIGWSARPTPGASHEPILVAGGSHPPSPTPAQSPRPTPALSPSPTPAPSPSPTPAPSPSPTPVPSHTAVPTPTPVPAPLSGVLVPPDVAAQPVVAVMVDDLRPARPQSGYSAASVVWQAPAEGGIPRYMFLYQEGAAVGVGPVRSARHYFIAWAAEWRAVYVHSGASPLALRTLRTHGHGEYVYDANEFRWGGRYLSRIRGRTSPHNVYTDGERLQRLARAVGAKEAAAPLEPAWQFAPDAPLSARPEGGRIELSYPANQISYRYQQATNRYLRSVSGEKEQVDAATGERVAPANVVIIVMRFAPLRDGTTKGRLEADVVGEGVAHIATNGRTITGTWRKDSITAPTRFYGPGGEPVTLTIGQTFVQVVPIGTKLTIRDGVLPPPNDPAAPQPA